MYNIGSLALKAGRGVAMKVESIYPVIGTDKIVASRDFYIRYFDFAVSFEAEWYISLKSKHNPRYELALLDYGHASVPQAYRHPARGVLINIEVAEVDGVYEKLKQEGLTMLLELRSEEWGQRHFITQDPNGLLIDVIQNIEPEGEYAQQYQ
jgi:catechol 2,3-dioxygenase-like lactoylglutathione lyase family enzyme